MALWSGIPLLVAFASFATAAVVSTRPLTSDVIFPAISLFMLLQFPLAMVKYTRPPCYIICSFFMSIVCPSDVEHHRGNCIGQAPRFVP